MSAKACSIDGCGKPSRARGWCSAHYTKWFRYGHPTQAVSRDRLLGKSQHPEDRFLRYAGNTSKGCWEWQGSRNAQGYGQFSADRKTVSAHRWGYENWVGQIPVGYEVDHLCRNPPCVNPEHLEAVPPIVNKRRSDSPSEMNRRKTHCYRGHEFTPENIKRTPEGNRRCLTCWREYMAAYDRRRRGPLRSDITDDDLLRHEGNLERRTEMKETT